MNNLDYVELRELLKEVDEQSDVFNKPWDGCDVLLGEQIYPLDPDASLMLLKLLRKVLPIQEKEKKMEKPKPIADVKIISFDKAQRTIVLLMVKEIKDEVWSVGSVTMQSDFISWELTVSGLYDFDEVLKWLRSMESSIVETEFPLLKELEEMMSSLEHHNWHTVTMHVDDWRLVDKMRSLLVLSYDSMKGDK